MDTSSSQPNPVPVPAGSAIAPPPSLREIESSIRDQRYLLHVVMGVTVVLLITATLGFFHQIRALMSQAGQLNATAIELSKAVGDYETNTIPQMNRMFAEFQRFAQTNAEFAKVIARYRVVSEGTATNAPGTGATPALGPR